MSLATTTADPTREDGERRALLLWGDGRPPATVVAVLEDAGLEIAIAADLEAAARRAVDEELDLVLVGAPPPNDAGWLGPLREAAPWLELVALGSPRDPTAAWAAAMGVLETVNPLAVSPDDLAQRLGRTARHSRLQRENHLLRALKVRGFELLSAVEIELLQELVLQIFGEQVQARRTALWVRNRQNLLALRAHRGPPGRAALPAQLDPQEGPLAARLESGQPFLDHADGEAGDVEPPKLYVPLRVGGQTLGLLLLTEKAGGVFGAREQSIARALAPFAALALRNAGRFTELERVGLRNRESPTYNLSYFVDYASKELYKASRYGRQFSLSAFHLDNLEQLRGRLTPAAFAETLRQVIGALAALARDSDVLARVAENELYLILPETDRFGVLMLERRVNEIVRALNEAAAESRPEVILTVGSATYPRDGQDFDELLHHCREQMAEARQTLGRRLQLGDLDLWQSLTALLGPWPARVEAQAQVAAGASYHGALPDDHFLHVQREIGRELARNPRSRGLLYMGSGDPEARFPLLEFLPPELAARICLLVRRGHGRFEHPAITTVFHQGVGPGAPVSAQHEFLLYLSEESAYAYARRRRESQAFHSSDRPLVDLLISRLQQAYDLRPY